MCCNYKRMTQMLSFAKSLRNLLLSFSMKLYFDKLCTSVKTSVHLHVKPSNTQGAPNLPSFLLLLLLLLLLFFSANLRFSAYLRVILILCFSFFLCSANPCSSAHLCVILILSYSFSASLLLNKIPPIN